MIIVPYFADRERRADRYPWLEWKVRLFSAGAVLAVAGIVMEIDWVVWLAVVVLAAAFLVRFLPGGRGEVVDEDEDPLAIYVGRAEFDDDDPEVDAPDDAEDQPNHRD
ncbi:MAG: hypothetical protein EA352_03795 [Gemmatimonadales bacterium]|nr:MAG: hypothetical protein EA352_03795 [Gemmatimonadales bacterium]